MGGRSGFRLIRSIWFLRFLAPSNHRFRSDRSQNFTMMGAFSLLFSLWHAAICESAAFTTRRCDFARSIVALRVADSFFVRWSLYSLNNQVPFARVNLHRGFLARVRMRAVPGGN